MRFAFLLASRFCLKSAVGSLDNAAGK